MDEKRKISTEEVQLLKDWLKKQGWLIKNPKGTYEMFRAVKPGRTIPFLVYQKRGVASQVIVVDRGNKTVDAFLEYLSKSKK